MTTTALHDTHVQDAAPRRRMDPARKVALAGGIAYLITFAASIPQLKLFADVVDDPAGYISGQHSNSTLLWGSWLEVVTAVACVGTAVALYPVTRRVSRTAAIGFVTSRIVEATLILVGVVSLLSLVTLQGDFAGATGAQAEALGVTGAALVAMRQWTFLLPRPDPRDQRAVPRHCPLPRAARAPDHPDHRPRRRPDHPGVSHGDDLRRLGPGLRGRRALRPADRDLGALARRVADRQGLHAHARLTGPTLAEAVHRRHRWAASACLYRRPGSSLRS